MEKQKEIIKYKEVEKSIIKKYKKQIWKKFVKGINDYDLIQEGDKIAVCISGGKDSMLLAKCMQELQRHWLVKFELVFLVMDPGYNPYNKQVILETAEELNIPITVFESPIFDIVADVEETPCYLCARMRRGYLYKEAQNLGCNKIALGHHFDDAIETILMSMLYSGQIKTMMPKLHSTNYEGMELIRPLYLVKEEDIIAWGRYNELQFIQCACRLTEHCSVSGQGGGSKRNEMKQLIKKFRQINPYIDINIFKSVHDVNLETIIGYHDHKQTYDFLEVYKRGMTKE